MDLFNFNRTITEPAAQEACLERSYENVVFRARVDDAANLYVLVRSHPGRAYVLSSMQRVDGDWLATLRLPCGRYRYRYYAEFDGALVYVSPADVERRPVSMRRFDGEFYVGDRIRAAPATNPMRPQRRADRVAHEDDDEDARDGWRGSVHS